MYDKFFQVYVYDFDGVIIDTTEIKHSSYLEIAEHFSLGSSPALDEALNHELVGAERKAVAEWFKQKFPASSPELFVQMFAQKFQAQANNLALTDGFLKFFNTILKKKIPQFIVSAAPRLEIENLLAMQGISPELFDGIFGNEFGKKAGILVDLMKKLQLKDSKSLLFLGDMPSDYCAAQKACVSFRRIVSFVGTRSSWPEDLKAYSLSSLAEEISSC